MSTSSSSSQGRGETTGEAGSKSDATANPPAVEAGTGQTPLPPAQQLKAAPLSAALVSGLVYNVNYKKGKRKKRKYSSGLKEVQKAELGFVKASQRLSRAAERGLRTYRKRRDKSARRKKDGAIRDALENWSRGLGRALRVGSNAPYDFAKEVNTRRFSRQLRDTIRFITPPLFR
jgi:hypothetical protein